MASPPSSAGSTAHDPSPATPPTDIESQPSVSVTGAKADFEALRRQLTRTSSLYRVQTGQKDPEKEGEHVDDFDLLKYMRSSAAVREENGFKRKAVGLTWEKLSVTGVGGKKIWIRTFPDAIKDFVLAPVLLALKFTNVFASSPNTLLHAFDGSAKPGEMVLVLGRPGSGCTTFLKTIANKRSGFLSVGGEVSYGGISAAKMQQHYRGEVVYNQEDDVHEPVLTVAQTILFALKTKSPGKRLPNESTSDFNNRVLAVLLKMLGISHTAQTKVGSAYVRGISGGERKRVSIAEMMTTRASVCSWDNTTRGLDASTALDYAKSLRILADVFDITQFVTLYQAGERIYDLFDKVLIIDEGRQVYFGPAKEARQYMVSLGFADMPRQTTADYLTGCTDPNERRIAEGRDPSTVPTTPEALEAAFKASDLSKCATAKRDEHKKVVAVDTERREEFVKAVAEDKRRGVLHKSPYTVSFRAQVRALAIRQFQIKLQDRLGTTVSFVTAITVAIITGSTFLNLPTNASGAFTRGGVIFIALLFNSFAAFNELPSQMNGRPIMWKQTGFAFYRPAALTVAGTLADAPLQMFVILIFCLIVYFMAGLYNSAGAFFTFYAIVISGYFALSAFFRTIGVICMNYDVAARLGSVFIAGMVLYSGYLVPVFSMKRWLFWIYYINPLAYSFAAAMANEFSRINLTCDGYYITPFNAGGLFPQYPSELGPNQVCTLVGSTAGNPIVAGSNYIRANYEYETSIVWRNFGITIAFFVAFLFCQAVAVEKLKHGADAPSINVFAKENSETEKLNAELLKNKAAFRKGEAAQDLTSLVNTRKPFTWEALKYTVPVPGGHLQLLNDIYGYVKPGTLTALMGSSGAGKTTLLDVLANRKTIGVIEGSVLIDGRKTGRDFQRGTAYVEQMDTHEHTATVREAFRFSAYLRQPAEVSRAEKDRYVEEVIQLLELEDLADSIIGVPGFGLGVEARKRVTIGVELASKPQLLLFLDEPTSGLDGQSAFNIVRFLRKLASAGQAILVTVHQPNSLLFEHFDRLLLLKGGGRCVYFGDIGKDSNVIRSYFAKHGAHCPENANPAEYMLEAIGAGSRRMVGTKDWADLWLESPELVQVKVEIEELKKQGLANDESSDAHLHDEYATSFALQLRIVAQRTLLSFWRDPDYGFTRLFNHMAIALFVSLTFLNVGSSVADLQYRVFATFFITTLPIIIISQVEPKFIQGRNIFIRESSSKMYSQIVFALAQLAAEVPYSILCATVFFLLFYYPMGWNSESSRAGFQYLVIMATEFFAVTLGQGVAALSPTVFVAHMQNPFLLVVFSLFCGVTVPKPLLPHFWRSWLYYLDPFTRIISAVAATEMHGLPIRCLPREFHVFDPPAGQTCQEWAGPFIAVAGGYLADGSVTSACQYCQFAVGDQFYTQLGIDFDTRWRDWGILLCFAVFNCAVTIVASKFLKYANR